MQSPPQFSALTPDRGQRRQAIAEALLQEIVEGRLRPGKHLVTQELAGRFEVSHTPVREALITLAGVGVVDLLPNRGATVRRVTSAEVREICQVRRVLECEAVRSACGRIDPDALNAIRDTLLPLVAEEREGEDDRSRFIEKARAVDSRLHDLIAGSCGNVFLAAELGRLTILFRAFRDAAWHSLQAHNDYRRLTLEAREHLAIVESLLAGDRRAASRAMARHIRSGIKYWNQALADGEAPSGSDQPAVVPGATPEG